MICKGVNEAMNQKEKMKTDLLNEIEGYVMQLNYVKDLTQVKADIKKNREKMQCAPCFTLITECALSDAYLLAFMRLYDKSQQAKTIPNLIKKCRANADIFPSKEETLLKLDEFEKNLNEDEDIACVVKTLTTWRDSFHVHNDCKYFGEKLQNDKPALKTSQIILLENFTDRILDYLFSQLSSEEVPKPKYDRDLEKLLEP